MKKKIIEKNKNAKETETYFLTKIPILGYFFRRIKENKPAIEQTLKTGKKIPEKTKKISFLGIIKIIYVKTFRKIYR